MATDKEKMLAAKAYIKQRDYDAARRLLKQVDHPTAHKWLERLPPPKGARRKQVIRSVLVFLIVIALIGFVVVLIQTQYSVDIANQAARDFFDNR
jgi:ferric-dicitrate binding protein FerR (iron transport regulator)